MANGEPKWFMDMVQEGMIDGKDEEAEGITNVAYQSPFGGVGDGRGFFSTESIENSIENSIVDDKADCLSGQVLTFNDGGGEWVAATPQFVASTVLARKVVRDDGTINIAEDISDVADCSEININGKSYLMIDNSGPEELNPHKLQETIRELRQKLDMMEGKSIVGKAKNPINNLEEAIKVAESNLMTFGEMADSIVHGEYGGYGGYGAAEFDFTQLSNPYEPVSITVDNVGPNDRVTLVSREDADYERAMSVVGK